MRHGWRLMVSVCLSFGVMAGQSTSDLATRAGSAMQTGDYAEAERLFLSLSASMPDTPEVYSNLGLARYYGEKRDLARESFRKALALKSTLFVPKFYLGRIDCEEGKYADAIPLLRQAVKLQPREPASRTLLADTLSRVGFKTEAIGQYQQLLRDQPGDSNSLAGLTQAYLDEAKRLALLLKASHEPFATLLKAESDSTLPEWSSVAMEEWSQAISKITAVPGVRLPFADFLLNTNRVPQAEAVLQQEIAIDPFSYAALFRLAEVNLLQGNAEAAAERLERAVQIRPEFFKPLPSMPVLPEHADQSFAMLTREHKADNFGRAFLLHQLAQKAGFSEDAARWAAVAEKQRDEAELRITSKRKPSAAPAGLSQERTVGLKYIEEKRLDQGLRLLLPQAKAPGADRNVKLAVVRGLFEARRLQELTALLGGAKSYEGESLYLLVSSYKTLAIATMESLVKIDPQSADVYRLMAESFSDRKQFKEAAEQYRYALQLRPQDPELYFGLGEAYSNQMMFEEAAQAYGRAIELRPSESAFYVMRASSLLDLHRPEEALPVAKKALELSPDLPQAHACAGRALALMGKDLEAIQQLEKAASIDDDGMLHYNLFKLYRKLGRSEEANRSLQISNSLRRRVPGATPPNAPPEVPGNPQDR